MGESRKACAGKPAGLVPNQMAPLPLGAIKPEGWLKFQLGQMTEGLLGRLYEHSEFLTPGNGWLTATGTGWEEQPYWFRSFVKLAALTGNDRCLAVAREWVEKILATRDADGWFGPAELKEHRFSDGQVLTDIWGHMVMCEALFSWWEYSGDARVLDLLKAFFTFCAKVPSGHFISLESDAVPPDFHWHYWIQCDRAGDLMPCLFRIYEMTGDEALLKLADRLMRKVGRPGAWMDGHTVNFAQRFAYWTLYSRRTGNPADRASADYWYAHHMSMWGQMPRGAFAADERCRFGCYDPRQGTESCTWGELTRSFNLLGDLSGDTKWADRDEDVVFNHAPAAYSPGWKKCHYLTAPNQLNLDARADHNYFNGPPMVAYSSERYRCCRHNAAMTFPIFTENLVKQGADGALVFWMYAPHSGKTVLDGGNAVCWKLDTRYPFRETADLEITCAASLKLRFRIPGWAKGFAVGDCTAPAGAAWLEMTVPAGTTRLSVKMVAQCEYSFWPRSGGVTVDRGPLSYSLAIPEMYRTAFSYWTAGGSRVWEEPAVEGYTTEEFLEVVPPDGFKWNYALDVAAPLDYGERDWNDDCFFSGNAPCEITATGRLLPEWTLQDNQPAALQCSPALTDAPLEKLRFVPLGCQRLRLSVLPQATDDADIGIRWQPIPATTPRDQRPADIKV